MRNRRFIWSAIALSGLMARPTAAEAPPPPAPAAPALPVAGPPSPIAPRATQNAEDTRLGLEKALRAAVEAPDSTGKSDEVTGPTPPGLSLRALCLEAQPSGPSPEEVDLRKKIAVERDALAKEKVRNEKMAQDIAKARDALRAETARLEQILKWAGSKEGNKASDLQAALANKTQLESLAKTMKELPPVKAADLFRRMPRPIGVELLRKMKPVNVAAVLANLDPKLAAEVMETLAVNSPTKGGTQ